MASVRARVIIVHDGTIALIERRRAGLHYYVFPGGGVERGETIEEAAAREAREELGLIVTIGRRVAEVAYQDTIQHFFLATPRGGFGSGSGPEFGGQYPAERGSYRPLWLPIADFPGVDIHPRAVAHLVATASASGWSWPGTVTRLPDELPPAVPLQGLS